MNSLLKLKTFLWSLLAISATLSATQECCSELMQETAPSCFSRPLFEVKAGYFFFSDSKMHKVYDKGGIDVQLCATYPLCHLTNRWSLNAYAAVEYFHQSGKSINGHQTTSLWSVPVNLGLKSVYAINANLQSYFTFGPRCLYLRQHNNSPYVYKNKSGNTLGFFANTGLTYLLCKQLVVDVFGEYSYAKMRVYGGRPRVYTRNIQVGGFTFGGGLGYEF